MICTPPISGPYHTPLFAQSLFYLFIYFCCDVFSVVSIIHFLPWKLKWYSMMIQSLRRVMGVGSGWFYLRSILICITYWEIVKLLDAITLEAALILNISISKHNCELKVCTWSIVRKLCDNTSLFWFNSPFSLSLVLNVVLVPWPNVRSTYLKNWK